MATGGHLEGLVGHLAPLIGHVECRSAASMRPCSALRVHRSKKKAQSHEARWLPRLRLTRRGSYRRRSPNMPNQTTYRGASGTSPKPRKYCNTTKVAWESKNEEFMRIAS